jgi:hypothetical protein
MTGDEIYTVAGFLVPFGLLRQALWLFAELQSAVLSGRRPESWWSFLKRECGQLYSIWKIIGMLRREGKCNQPSILGARFQGLMLKQHDNNVIVSAIQRFVPLMRGVAKKIDLTLVVTAVYKEMDAGVSWEQFFRDAERVLGIAEAGDPLCHKLIGMDGSCWRLEVQENHVYISGSPAMKTTLQNICLELFSKIAVS